jgi:class 3 adenylate cyclase/pimeloyl-ACP methyl ester carboxylesterase
VAALPLASNRDRGVQVTVRVKGVRLAARLLAAERHRCENARRGPTTPTREPMRPMRPSPEIHYAKRGEHHLAYTLTGSGPLELVYLLGFVSHLDLLWDDPDAARFFSRLGAFCRVVTMDKRGTGLSDRTGDVPIPEEQVDDLLAVIDAAGFTRPAILGTQDGFIVAALLAASAPDRVRALIGVSTGAAGPEQWPAEESERFFAGLEKYWGREDAPFNYWAPRRWRSDPQFRRWWARYSRSAAGPTTAVQIVRNYTRSDIRPILSAIRIPTLVITNASNDINRRFAHQLSDGVEGAQLVELPIEKSVSLFPWLEAGEEIAGMIEGFLTGNPVAGEPDRVLATVMFTDVVQSTERAAALGDQRWRALLDQHDAIVAREVARFRGRLVKSTGDGVLVTFDGPARAVRCGLALIDALAVEEIPVRVAVHTGEIELRGEDVGGIGVHLASRLLAHAQSDEVITSSTVKDLVVGSGLEFADRGEHELKGVPGSWRLFEAHAKP